MCGRKEFCINEGDGVRCRNVCVMRLAAAQMGLDWRVSDDTWLCLPQDRNRLGTSVIFKMGAAADSRAPIGPR